MLSRLQRSNLIRSGIVTLAWRRGGYSLYDASTGRPLARLRLTGHADTVEILFPASHGWRPVGDFGGIVLPVDQAIRYVADNLMI
jgi:hypothetical protein